MSKETKISIGILVIGLIGLGIYWFSPVSTKLLQDGKSGEAGVEEKIILPQYSSETYRNISEVQAYLSELKALIRTGQAVLPLPNSELDRGARKAQALLLKDPDFLKDTHNGGTLMHNDMMRILPAIVSSMDTRTQGSCKIHACYQAEKYNFVTNATTRAIVDIDAEKVLLVDYFPNTQPDISYRLKKIAEAIALNAPEVKKELGHVPMKKDITMANVRGSMKESPCENTTHLCVAPTFADHKKERALWAVIDLTQMRLAAAKWAGLGKTTTPACISERSLENRYIMENYCQKDSTIERDGWKIVYRLTASDGLEIRDVMFRGERVLRSAKIVDWHVAYQQEEGGENLDTTTETYIEGRRVEYVRGENGKYMFGYNDAMGCPMFSTSVVLAFNGPQVLPLKSGDGFMLTQDFRNPKWPMACNYRYENRFEFYTDGAFRVVGVNKGRGCGDNAVYRPVMRIDFDLGDQEHFYSYQGGNWKLWDQEKQEHVGLASADQATLYPYKISAPSNDRGYYLEPNHGQFGDNSRGDHANLFITRFKENEGDKDLLTLGSCCQLDEDGPERYVEGESVVDHRIVLWYIPRIRNDARQGHEYCWADTRIGEDGNLDIKVWPCTVGPKFIPIKAN
jgi:hypothetical protein